MWLSTHAYIRHMRMWSSRLKYAFVLLPVVHLSCIDVPIKPDVRDRDHGSTRPIISVCQNEPSEAFYTGTVVLGGLFVGAFAGGIGAKSFSMSRSRLNVSDKVRIVTSLLAWWGLEEGVDQVLEESQRDGYAKAQVIGIAIGFFGIAIRQGMVKIRHR